MAGRGRPRRFDRDAALRIAMELFWEHGYEGTSMSMLTSAMGITSTSLYAAFGSKDGLFREAVRLYTSSEGAPTDRALRRPTTRDAIEALLRDNAEAYLDPGTPRGCMVVLSGLNLATGNEQVGRYLTELRCEDFAMIRKRIERGVADGDLPEGVDTEALAAYSQTVLQGLSIQVRDGCGRERVQAVVDAAMVGWDAFVRQAEEREDGGFAESAESGEGRSPSR